MKSWRLWEGRWLALGHAASHLPPKSYLLQLCSLLLRATNDVIRWGMAQGWQLFSLLLIALSCFHGQRRQLFSCSVMSTLCDPMDCSTPGFPALHYLLEFAQTHVHWVDDAIQPSHSLSLKLLNLLLLPSTFPSIRVFFNELVLCMRWPKYWSFSFSLSPSSEYSGLPSFRIDWIDLLAVSGTQQRQIKFTKQTFKEKFVLCLGKEQTRMKMQACLLSEYTS